MLIITVFKTAKKITIKSIILLKNVFFSNNNKLLIAFSIFVTIRIN